jgi:UDP-N-acetylmuramoyl-tripeptide--D-alanyl-D-alanine ligase
MNEAIQSFADYKPVNPWLILGDMFELGSIAHEEHKKIINLLISENYSNVLLMGKEFYTLKDSNKFLSFKTTGDAKTYLRKNKISGATILIKGSRGMQLEQLLEYL